MLLCKSSTSRWLSLRRAQDRWFLINQSILLSRGRSRLMIMRPAATALQHWSTFNQGGVRQGWLVLKRESCNIYDVRRRRDRRSKSWRLGNLTNVGPSSLRARCGGSSQLTSQQDRSDHSYRPVWPLWLTGQTGPACSWAESRIRNARFGSLQWRNTTGAFSTRWWGASGSWGYTRNASTRSSTRL